MFQNKQINTTDAQRVHAIIRFLKLSPDAAYPAFRECIREIGRGDLLDKQGCLPLIDTAEAELSQTNKLPEKIIETQANIDPVGSATSSVPESGMFRLLLSREEWIYSFAYLFYRCFIFKLDNILLFLMLLKLNHAVWTAIMACESCPGL